MQLLKKNLEMKRQLDLSKFIIKSRRVPRLCESSGETSQLNPVVDNPDRIRLVYSTLG